MKCPHCHKSFETDPVADYNKHIRATEKKIKKLVQAEFPGKEITVYLDCDISYVCYLVTMWMEDDSSFHERLGDFCRIIATPDMQLYTMVYDTELTKAFSPAIYKRRKK
jgi:hypothetical protein